MTRERCDCRYPNGHDVAAGHVTAAAADDGDVAEADGVAVEHVAAVAADAVAADVVVMDVVVIDVAVIDVIAAVAHADAVDVGRQCRVPSALSCPST